MSKLANPSDFFNQVPKNFTVIWPDGSTDFYGQGQPTFSIRLASQESADVFLSLNELRIAEAYLDGSYDVEGCMLDFVSARQAIRDVHSVARRIRFWFSFLNPLLTNQHAIARHYDVAENIQL